MRHLDGERRQQGRPTLQARSALRESLAETEAERVLPSDLVARRAGEEARRAAYAREEMRAGHARMLSITEVERELDLPAP